MTFSSMGTLLSFSMVLDEYRHISVCWKPVILSCYDEKCFTALMTLFHGMYICLPILDSNFCIIGAAANCGVVCELVWFSSSVVRISNVLILSSSDLSLEVLLLLKNLYTLESDSLVCYLDNIDKKNILKTRRSCCRHDSIKVGRCSAFSGKCLWRNPYYVYGRMPSSSLDSLSLPEMMHSAVLLMAVSFSQTLRTYSASPVC